MALRRARAAGLARLRCAVMLRRAVSGAGLKCVTQLSCAVDGAERAWEALACAVMLRLRRAWARDYRRSPGMRARKR